MNEELDQIEMNSNECCEVIYDSYFDIEDIDLSASLLNPHDQSLIKCENEEHSNLEIVSSSSHFQIINHTHDFSIRENITFYDLYTIKISFLFIAIILFLIHKSVLRIIQILLF